MRTSESKTIINQELFDVKLPDYQRIIERLVSKYNVVDGSYYEGLVNFKTNLVVPKHKWYDYKQGYSELLVKHIIDEAKPLNPEKPDVPLNKNDAFQKVQKRRVQKKR